MRMTSPDRSAHADAIVGVDGIIDPSAAAYKWLVTGATGRLGGELLSLLRGLDAKVQAPERRVLETVDARELKRVTRDVDIVVNAAAWTDVDAAEERPAEAMDVNGIAVRRLAEACEAAGAALIHVSTDYVFDGAADQPYREDAETRPLNAYGRSKRAGEIAAVDHGGLVVRTARLYGGRGPDMLRWLLRAADRPGPVPVVADETGQPTWTRAVAAQVVALGAAALRGDVEPGIFHGTAAGAASWYGFAEAVFAERGLPLSRLRAVDRRSLRQPAARPRYSVLGHDRWADGPVAALPDWRTMLSSALRHRFG
jgi:dTDP-4-dehydrorhamnose reductase